MEVQRPSQPRHEISISTGSRGWPLTWKGQAIPPTLEFLAKETGSATLTPLTVSPTLRMCQWRHVAVTGSGSTFTLYFDDGNAGRLHEGGAQDRPPRNGHGHYRLRSQSTTLTSCS